MTVKGRSPNYPQLTLRDAVEKVRKVYQAEHTYKANKEVVAKDLGYNSLNGSSLTLIGALKRYGLLEAEGDGFRVSDDAVAILELSENDSERIAALKRAAFTSPLFAELHEIYGDRLPSDVNLRHDLIKRKFLPKAADEVVRIYRDNLELVTQFSPEYNAPQTEQTIQTPSVGATMQQQLTSQVQNASRVVPSLGGQLHFPFYLSKELQAALYVPVNMNKREYDLLKKQIEHSLLVMEATAVTDDDPENKVEGN